MSQWTHVCGCVRIGTFGIPTTTLTAELRSKFGNTWQFDDSPKKYDACNVPRGSEGSIQYKIIRTGTNSSLAWGLVVIWGDLRDYDNHEEIYQWIRRACQSEMYFIRDCSLTIRVGHKDEYMICQRGDDIVQELLPCDKANEGLNRGQ